MSSHHASIPETFSKANEKGLEEERIEYVSSPNGDDHHIHDTEAVGYLNPSVVITLEENRRLLRLINTRVLPCMIICYLAQALDKGVLGTASIMGLQQDTGMVGQDYALTNTILWIGVIVGELPANRLVQIIPLAKFVSVSLILWGLVLLAMSFLRNVKAILALRFVLGFLESVSGPVLLAISVMWYKRHEQPLVVSGYQTMIGANSVISGLLGYGFYHVQNSTLYGWQYLMILIAGLSILMGAFIAVWMPDSPPRAKCFSEEDKVLMVERVRANDQGLRNTHWNPAQAREAFREPLIYMLFLAMVLNTLITGGLGSFSALLINQAFGFDVLDSQLLSMPLGVFSMTLLMTSSYAASRTKQTIYVILALSIPNIAGSIVLLTVTPGMSTRAGLLVAFYIMQCFQAQSPLILTVTSRNIAGQSKKVIAYAATFIGWSGGNAISSQIFQSQWAPRYINSLYIHCGIYALFIILMLSIRIMLVRRNREKERAAEGLREGHGHRKAFDDLTDRENPEFRYTL
ncbi:MFS general substrate transporter [Dacryopinax primogenitus]|uniref:MFS general substrate transporter n=1 Tax=Dacryopinax primogenitus (strain DJM 731) TaxID=1858805 RepID=M5FQM4_DACPD|nr:MFS general substrate transporter [Dacryopinax primogenitus]EJT97059.1 MFS general substrate transporter [Dacryopinax primogenitus]